MLTAATGITFAAVLCPAGVQIAPTMIPTLPLKLYSIAGATLSAAAEGNVFLIVLVVPVDEGAEPATDVFESY